MDFFRYNGEMKLLDFPHKEIWEAENRHQIFYPER